MSTTITDVLNNSSYDPENNLKDALWLLEQRDEIQELLELAESLRDLGDEYEDYVFEQESEGNYDVMSFEEWRENNE